MQNAKATSFRGLQGLQALTLTTNFRYLSAHLHSDRFISAVAGIVRV
ncbi:hypothetical protein [Nostoc sp. FACHB-133]|nr:hypothetical protein [Nostoc sp. FACHB-133]MBD2526853.1 hypothetical protein [Nostoc sp. FACHB-133]